MAPCAVGERAPRDVDNGQRGAVEATVHEPKGVASWTGSFYFRFLSRVRVCDVTADVSDGTIVRGRYGLAGGYKCARPV